MTARQPLALSLAGFQFTYRSSYFDWRLLHGIDIDNVIRLTDVQAVEDCLDTLQRGAFAAERDRLLPANCVQLFRLLQLAIEYCGHLRAAHALLLDCYNKAMAAAESWKTAARAYLDTGSIFLADSMATGALSRPALDATDWAKQALEAADRQYNVALDSLEAEDTRARHFRFRKHRTEISWSMLHATDVDRLVTSLDLTALEVLLPNLTYGSITNEDDEQLTPHHFEQLVPLAQAALDYVLWQANATGALLEQAMVGLQAACSDIPMLTSATREMHANITSLLLGAQQNGGATYGSTATPMALAGPGGGGGGAGGSAEMGFGSGAMPGSGSLGLVQTASGTPGPWTSASVDMGQPYGQQYGTGRLGTSPPLIRSSSPAQRPLSGGPGGAAQVLRLGSAGPGASRLGLGTATPGGGANSYLTAYGSRGLSGSGNLDEVMAAGGVPPGTAAFPVLELHSRTAELSYKVESIEQDLRLERNKTEEMRRILSDIRDRLNIQQPASSQPQPQVIRVGSANAAGGASYTQHTLTGLSPAESLTFPAAGAIGATATLASGLGPPPSSPGGGAGPYYPGGGLTGASAFLSGPSAMSASGSGGAGGGGSAAGGNGLRGSAAGVTFSGVQQQEHSPMKVRVILNEDAIREQEQQRAVELLTKQTELLTQQLFREHMERRQATASMSASPQLVNVSNSASGLQGLASRLAQQEVGSSGGGRHSRPASRDGRRNLRRSSPGKPSRPGSGSSTHHVPRHGHQQSFDYTSDVEMGMLMAGSGGNIPDDRPSSSRKVSAGGASVASGAAAAGSSRPPKPLSRLSSPMTMHGSLGDLPSAAATYSMPHPGRGGGGGPGGQSRFASGPGAPGGGYRGQSPGTRTPVLSDSADDALPLPAPSALGTISVDASAGVPAIRGAAQRPQSAGVPQAVQLAATSAFGSISLVGPDKGAQAAAAHVVAAGAGGSGHMSKASSFSDYVPRHSNTAGQGAAGAMGSGAGGAGAAGNSGGGGWDAAGAVAASFAGRRG